jgi:hypothetical protein
MSKTQTSFRRAGNLSELNPMAFLQFASGQPEPADPGQVVGSNNPRTDVTFRPSTTEQPSGEDQLQKIKEQLRSMCRKRTMKTQVQFRQNLKILKQKQSRRPIGTQNKQSTRKTSPPSQPPLAYCQDTPL